MKKNEKKNKIKGVIATFLFHLFLFISFLFLGLTYKTPPPPEQGISINFGFSDSGTDKTEPQNDSKADEKLIENTITESNSEKEIISQQTNKTVQIINSKDKTDNPDQKKIIKKEKEEINKKALYTGKNKNKNTTEGQLVKEENQGNKEGNKNTKNNNGLGLGIEGDLYQLNGRQPRDFI